jgi:hypothetical protein
MMEWKMISLDQTIREQDCLFIRDRKKLWFTSTDPWRDQEMGKKKKK